jgi:phage-related protein
VLEIDCENMLVKLNGVEDMLLASGAFPSLLPGANVINVSGFSGTLNIAYREKYI